MGQTYSKLGVVVPLVLLPYWWCFDSWSWTCQSYKMVYPNNMLFSLRTWSIWQGGTIQNMGSRLGSTKLQLLFQESNMTQNKGISSIIFNFDSFIMIKDFINHNHYEIYKCCKQGDSHSYIVLRKWGNILILVFRKGNWTQNSKERDESWWRFVMKTINK